MASFIVARHGCGHLPRLLNPTLCLDRLIEDTSLPGHHRADNNFSASWRDLEIQIQPFYEFERRKELDGGAMGRGVLLHHEKRLLANHRSSDNTIVIFGVSGPGVFRRGHTI